MEAVLRKGESDLAGAQVCVEALLAQSEIIVAVANRTRISALLAAAHFSAESNISNSLGYYRQALVAVPESESELKPRLNRVARHLGETLFDQQDARAFDVNDALVRLAECSFGHPNDVRMYRAMRDEAQHWRGATKQHQTNDLGCPTSGTFLKIIGE